MIISLIIVALYFRLCVAGYPSIVKKLRVGYDNEVPVAHSCNPSYSEGRD
jgi:hypothetical protein